MANLALTDEAHWAGSLAVSFRFDADLDNSTEARTVRQFDLIAQPSLMGPPIMHDAAVWTRRLRDCAGQLLKAVRLDMNACRNLAPSSRACKHHHLHDRPLYSRNAFPPKGPRCRPYSPATRCSALSDPERLPTRLTGSDC